MSIPNPPPERQSAYEHPHGQHAAPPPAETTPVAPVPVAPAPVAPAPVAAAPVAASPPSVAPAAAEAFPAPVAAVPVAAVPARPAGPSVDSGRYWAGVAATALVAALVGVVGVVVLDQILKIDLVVKDIFSTDSVGAAYAIGGALSAVVAGALLQLLVLTTPRPRAFFGWIMFLALVVAALIPLTWTDVHKSAIASGALNLLIGIAIWSLLSGVLSRTLRPGSVVE